MASLAEISTMLNKMLAAQNIDDWQDEPKDNTTLVGHSRRQLQEMRKDPAHASGWRYKGDGVSRDNKTIRRNIQWSKSYLNSLYKQVA